jgi:phosphatidylserine decarboxylase
MKKRLLPFARGCERELLAAAAVFVLSVLLVWAFPNGWTNLIAVIAMIVFAMFLLFFRDPERTPPDDPNLLVSPADGRVVMIKDVSEERHIGGEATRVSIFLSLFDVHVNRSPLKAQVCWTEHRAGEFKNAAFADASEVNERQTIALQAGSTKIIVRQIAGLVARRIVCWAQKGRTLERGERLGLIKFGSRVDVLLPRGTQVLVKVGDTVRGGETAIAKLPMS